MSKTRTLTEDRDTGNAVDPGRTPARGSRFLPVLAAITALAAVTRLGRNDRPGFDVDESLYAHIAASVAKGGALAAKTEFIGRPRLYLSHPPFLFLVEAGWFRLVGAGIVQARWLSGGAGVVTVVAVALLLRRHLGDGWALLAAAFVAVDGWITFTNRVAWAENVQIPIGILALAVFLRLVRSPTTSGRLLLAGAVLGMITVYKYVGACFLLTGLTYLMLDRRRAREPALALAGASAVALLYGVAMLCWTRAKPFTTRAQFFADNGHQLLRTTGKVESRGSLTGSTEIITALVNQYRIYAASVGVLVAVAAIMCWRILQCVRGRCLDPIRRVGPFLFAWAGSAYLMFGAARLWMPHYLILILVPAFCYLVAELRCWVASRPDARPRLLPLLVAAVVAAGGLTATAERMVLHHDNAVGDTITWMTRNAPPDARVIADEFMGNQIPQPYCNITHAVLCDTVADPPDYLIAYETITQRLPPSKTLTQLLATATPVARFSGFKETIVIYRIRR